MILPTIQLPLSVKIFDINLKYFVHEYELEKLVKININEITIGGYGKRYEISFDKKHMSETECAGVVFGELETIPLEDKRTEVRTAVIEIERIPYGKDFFFNFYNMVQNKWNCKFLFDKIDKIILSNETGGKIIPISLTQKKLDWGISEKYLYPHEEIDPEKSTNVETVYKEYPPDPPDNPIIEQALKERLFKIEQGLPKLEEFEDKKEEDAEKLSLSSYLPEKDETRAKWKQAYDIIVDTREKHLEVDFLDKTNDKRSLTYKDYQDAIADGMKWTTSEKTVSKIMKVGDAGLLK